MEKTNNHSSPEEVVPKKHHSFSRLQKIISIIVAAVLVIGTIAALVGQSTQAHAATTGGDPELYSLQDANQRYLDIGVLRVDGNAAVCVQIDESFATGITVYGTNAKNVYGQDNVTKFALLRDYIYTISWINDVQRYMIFQAIIWEELEPSRFPAGGLIVGCGVSTQNQINIKAEARAYYNANRSSFIGGGTYWSAGANQDLAEFWIERRATGSIKLIVAVK